ncbi:NADPH-glutathione reductase [Halothece sp. PCC 7418]|uniref:glutathione-disulfide reductase n=1 Tax=Halothece sp. (strain PCC 7418) TaxID=65093 RepID=UPI0002A078FA|nr:glutathione-disulfide reductase [Halothece sp. PCC 7418]AFZ43718.1 NADPH-glutathione reductase [Halothece sp. PCC 7418]
MSYDYDLFVIGGGSGGIAAARRATEYGAKVGLAEFDRLGGTCVNRGCIPKKLMVYGSHFPHWFEDAKDYGWSVGEATLDWTKMTKVVNGEVDRLNGVYQRMLDKADVTVYRGYAQFIDAHTLKIGEEKVTADKILIAVGGIPEKADVPGIEHAIISDAMFTLPQQPKRFVVLGGGYIGVEFGCILNALGSQVTQIIRRPYILRGFDHDIREHLQNSLIEQGVNVWGNTEITSIEKTKEGFKLTTTGDRAETITADVVLAATGRIPRLEKLGLENTSVEVNNGAIAVNDYSCTTVPNIFAVGDCTDRINLTPVAIQEGRAFADTEFGGKDRIMSHENVPSAVFTSPEAATVGFTEAEAKEQFGEDDIQIYRARFGSTYFSVTQRKEKAMLKLVVQKSSDRVLGAHMVGEAAAEIMQGVAIPIKMGATKADFDATVAIHPSVAEEFVTMR